MGLFKRSAVHADAISPDTDSGSPHSFPLETKDDIATVHQESTSVHEEHSKWKVSKAGDGDVAMGLFKSPTDVHEPIDPADEKKLVRKIDLMILPYLAVVRKSNCRTSFGTLCAYTLRL